jgi:hypothetical protein
VHERFPSHCAQSQYNYTLRVLLSFSLLVAASIAADPTVHGDAHVDRDTSLPCRMVGWAWWSSQLTALISPQLSSATPQSTPIPKLSFPGEKKAACVTARQATTSSADHHGTDKDKTYHLFPSLTSCLLPSPVSDQSYTPDPDGDCCNILKPHAHRIHWPPPPCPMHCSSIILLANRSERLGPSSIGRGVALHKRGDPAEGLAPGTCCIRSEREDAPNQPLYLDGSQVN